MVKSMLVIILSVYSTFRIYAEIEKKLYVAVWLLFVTL
jgi:hypothetical protein